VYKIYNTENIMDYSHNAKPAIERITITKWQWLKLQGVLSKETPPSPPQPPKPTSASEAVGDYI
jgi:hypothetical protein